MLRTENDNGAADDAAVVETRAACNELRRQWALVDDLNQMTADACRGWNDL